MPQKIRELIKNMAISEFLKKKNSSKYLKYIVPERKIDETKIFYTI